MVEEYKLIMKEVGRQENGFQDGKIKRNRFGEG
jgi:hypothetical protein